MNGLPYYKRYPRDFIEGTIGMSLEIKGAYAILLDLIYLHGGECPDDRHYIATALGCSLQLWTKIKKALIDAGKIVVKDDKLSNNRAESEMKLLRKFQQSQQKAAQFPRPSRLKSTTSANQPEPEPEPDKSAATLRYAAPAARGVCSGDVLGRMEEVYEALGEHANQRANGRFMEFGELINWVDNGCDFDLDILPTIRSLSMRGGRIGGWGYFRQAVFEAKQRRLAPPPKPVDSPLRVLDGGMLHSAASRPVRRTMAGIALEMAARCEEEELQQQRSIEYHAEDQ